ncbi:hypothetical protein TWF103_000807 [Orbilia oligospora]|nr:hypothetical protein TWF103_000807 [Orbilia oligospora]
MKFKCEDIWPKMMSSAKSEGLRGKITKSVYATSLKARSENTAWPNHPCQHDEGVLSIKGIENQPYIYNGSSSHMFSPPIDLGILCPITVTRPQNLQTSCQNFVDSFTWLGNRTSHINFLLLFGVLIVTADDDTESVHSGVLDGLFSKLGKCL